MLTDWNTTKEQDRPWEMLASPLAVVAKETTGLRYSFYTDDELRKLSVCKVDSAEQRDTLQRPLPGGLYDPAMGPTDQYGSCVTCGLDYATCPGHMGRIELAMPVYVPALFPSLVQLLRGSCLHCGRFRADAGRVAPFGRALDLLDAGLLVDAAKWLGASPGGSSEVRGEGELERWQERCLSAQARQILAQGDKRQSRRGKGCGSPHLVTLRKTVFNDLLKTLIAVRAT